MKNDDKKALNVMLELERHEKIDAIAERLGTTKSKAVRALLDIGIDTYRIYDKLGVVLLADVVRRNRDVLPNVLKNVI